jgi:hypothetical protein
MAMLRKLISSSLLVRIEYPPWLERRCAPFKAPD